MTYHPIICQMSNCELFTKPFHIHCYRLVIRSVVNFQMRRCSPNLSTFIAIELSKHRFNTFAKVVASNWLKTDFFGETLCLQKFSTGTESLRTQEKKWFVFPSLSFQVHFLKFAIAIASLAPNKIKSILRLSICKRGGSFSLE